MAWTLTNPAVVAPVLGVRTLAQLQDNLGSLEVELSEEHLARLDAVSRVPKVFPLRAVRTKIVVTRQWSAQRQPGGASSGRQVPAAGRGTASLSIER